MPARKQADRHDPAKQVPVGARIDRADFNRLESRRERLGMTRRAALIAAIRHWLDDDPHAPSTETTQDPRTRCSAVAPEDEQIRANRFSRIVKMRQADGQPTVILILEWVDGFQRRIGVHKNGTWIVKREGIPSAESELREIAGEEKP